MLLIAVEVAGAVCDMDCSKFSGTLHCLSECHDTVPENFEQSISHTAPATSTAINSIEFGRQHPPATRQSLAGRADRTHSACCGAKKLLRAVGPRR